MLAGAAAAVAAGPATAGLYPAPPLRRLLFVGDSLAHGIAVHMDLLLTPTGRQVRNARLDRLVFTGGGLIPRPRQDLVAATEARLAGIPPVDAVLVLAGINDVGMPLGSGVFYGEDWSARYGAQMNRLIDVIAAAGARIAWIGVPALAHRLFVGPMDAHIRPLQAATAAARPEVAYIDALALTTEDGGFATHRADRDGMPVRFRAEDGIHFTPAGYRLIARDLLVSLEAAFGWPLLPGPDWRILGE